MFGLSAGCLDVHLHALDTSFVKKTELKKIEAEYKQAQKHDRDLSVAQAEKICADYESWAEKHNTKHAYITDVLRKCFGSNMSYCLLTVPMLLLGGIIDVGVFNIDMETFVKEYTKVLLLLLTTSLAVQKINFMLVCKRLLTAEEEAKIQAILQKHGYSQAQACEMSKKMFIINDNVDCSAAYIAPLDCIGLNEYSLSAEDDMVFSHILLHELQHYKHCVGHIFCDPLSCVFSPCVFSPKEEQRADIEAMKKLQQHNQKNVLTNLDLGFGNEIELLDQGYVAHSPAVRNCIAYKVQKQKIEAQFA